MGGCASAQDKIEHYLVCSKVWASISKPIPAGLALSASRRNLQSMMLAEKGLSLDEKICICVAVYAIMRTVQTLRNEDQTLNAGPLMKLHMKEGVRGSKARARLKATRAEQKLQNRTDMSM